MLAKLIEMIGRSSHRPLALGVVLVSARGGYEPRPICYAQLRPASAWGSLLLLIVALGIGFASVQREAALSTGSHEASTAPAVAGHTTDTGAVRLAADSPTKWVAALSVRRS